MDLFYLTFAGVLFLTTWGLVALSGWLQKG